MRNKKKNTNQKRQKGGISLIVLVITIIVMVILAAAVVVTLNNTGILDKANTAVYNTNKAEVHTMVQLLLLEGKGTVDGTKLQEEVAKMGGTCVPNSTGGWNITIKNYSCSVMQNGTIGEFSSTTAEKNQYGFYENQTYICTQEGRETIFVIKADKSIEIYENNICSIVVKGEDVEADTNAYEFTYIDNVYGESSATLTTTDGINALATFVANVGGVDYEVQFELTCVFGLYHEIYFEKTYNIDSSFGGGNLIIHEDVSVDVTNNIFFGSEEVTMEYPLGANITHIVNMSAGSDTMEVHFTYDGKEAYIYQEDVAVKIGTLAVESTGNTPGTATNPYENAEWEMAWTCTNKVWSDTIIKGGTIPTGVDITAKLYKNGRTVEMLDGGNVQVEVGDAYTLVLEGTGEMGVLAEGLFETHAWFAEVTSSGDALVGSYIDQCIICDGITNIGGFAFGFAPCLNSITLPNSIISIDEGAFGGNQTLTSITLPNSVTSIGSSAFASCAKLTSITIPNSVTSIGWYTFNNCPNLTSIIIPSSVTSIGEYVFDDETGLINVTIQNNVISNNMFYGCASLTNVTITNSVTSIGESAFAGCTGLTSITIPSSVTSVGRNAFYGCTNLATVNIYSTSSGFTADIGAFEGMANPSTIYTVSGSGIASKFTEFNYDSSKTTISETLTAN